MILKREILLLRLFGGVVVVITFNSIVLAQIEPVLDTSVLIGNNDFSHKSSFEHSKTVQKKSGIFSGGLEPFKSTDTEMMSAALLNISLPAKVKSIGQRRNLFWISSVKKSDLQLGKSPSKVVRDEKNKELFLETSRMIDQKTPSTTVKVQDMKTEVEQNHTDSSSAFIEDENVSTASEDFSRNTTNQTTKISDRSILIKADEALEFINESSISGKNHDLNQPMKFLMSDETLDNQERNEREFRTSP